MTAPAVAVFGLFDTTVDAVYRLVPEADRVTDANNSQLPTPITEQTIQAWIVEVSAMLGGAIGPWSSLTGTTLTAVKDAASAAVANGVASYVEAARYPTMAGANDSSYASVLWARYQAMGTALAGVITKALEDGGTIIDPGTGVSAQEGPFVAGMPDPYFVNGEYWVPWAEAEDPRAAW